MIQTDLTFLIVSDDYNAISERDVFSKTVILKRLLLKRIAFLITKYIIIKNSFSIR